MSSPLYYPGAALPYSAIYPYKAELPYNHRQRWASTCTGPNSYSLRPVGCSGLAGAFCSGAYSDALYGQNLVHPFAINQDQLTYGTGPGTCGPVRGCLNPQSLTYDKYAQVHCPEMCVFKSPKICVAEEVRPYYGAAPTCPRDEYGRTSLERLYNAPQGSKERAASYFATAGVFDSAC